ncbi:MAG TPA: cyclodeaminase/cyclohydrolase family protein [Planctomycetota bacterium]|jgi:formiminotetrahydrofolate cyclodeaminase
MPSFIDEKLTSFLDSLSARTPTPGGGSASALGGAIGTALGTMAAGYTMGEKFRSVEPQSARIIEELTTMRHTFAALLQQDIDAYDTYSKARALPKSSSDEKKTRGTAILAAKEKATTVPEQIVETALHGLALIEELSQFANPNLAGDVAVAAYFLESAARGAAIQVLSNCASSDTNNAARRDAVKDRVARCEEARRRIDQAVLKMMKL